MEQIYSEEDLVQNKELPWGQWKFTLSNEEIASKIGSLPSSHIEENKDCQQWLGLLSLLRKETSDFSDIDKVPESEEYTPMECSHNLVSEEKEYSHNVDDDKSNEEFAICLVDLCNQVAPKLRLGLNTIQEEMKGFVEDISKVEDNSVTSIMLSAWLQLSSDASRLCFCIPFTSNNRMCKKLCEKILLPWFGKNLPSKIEQLSAILSEGGDTVIIHLVAPLLRIEDTPLVHDTINLEELMSFMAEKQWFLLLKELLSDMRELLKWQIPLLATVVEHAKPSFDELHLIVQIMSSTGMTFVQSRDFGSLLVAVAKNLRENAGLATQFKLIANNYKGPLKFKVFKLLEDIEV